MSERPFHGAVDECVRDQEYLTETINLEKKLIGPETFW